MKKILFIFAILFASIVFAADFQLGITQSGETSTVTYNKNDWIKVSENSTFDLYIEKSLVNNDKKVIALHSMSVIKEPKVNSVNNKKIYKTYSYGVVDCNDKKFYLLGTLYVDDKEEVMFADSHEFGEWVSNLTEKNTSRNDVYNVVCLGSFT